MKLLVTGGRRNFDFHLFRDAISKLPQRPTVIIHGGAEGTDTHADIYGKLEGIFVVRIDALWKYHGYGAGLKRNQAMLDIMHPDYCLAMPGGNGTKDMVQRCVKCGVPVYNAYGEVVYK